jgi:crossover junction endodeoxyribonuclease RuvC
VIVLAIDPGVQGAFAVLNADGVVALDDLPVHQVRHPRGKKLRAELSLHGICVLLRQHDPDHVFLERVGPMPKQGLSSTWRFAFSAGGIYGVVVANGRACTFVAPQVWQRHHRISSAPDEAIQRAMQLFPALAPRLARKRDEHKADAVLIAVYGQYLLRQPDRWVTASTASTKDGLPDGAHEQGPPGDEWASSMKKRGTIDANDWGE